MSNRIFCICSSVFFALFLGRLVTFSVMAQATPRAIVIHELAWAGTTNSSADEWIELHNPSMAPLSLDGWAVRSSDGSPSMTLAGIIPAGGYFLLERTDDLSADPSADQIYTGALSNSGEQLTLYDNTGGIVDVAGDGGAWFAGANTTKQTMHRTNVDGDGSLAVSWTDGLADGTPTNSIIDGDNDSYGYSPNIEWIAGDGPSFEQFAEDCDDSRNDTYPDAPEVFDVYDNDCDVELDEDFVLGELDYELYFNSQNLYARNTTTAKNEVEIALLNLIDSAETSIDAAIYGFSRVSLRDALLAAQQRGVEVRVAADYSEYHGSRSWPFAPMSHNFIAALAERDTPQSRSPAFFQQLEAAGISVYPSNYVSYLQHNKFMVVDGETTWTGSTNWTDTGLTANMNNALLLRSPHIARAYQIEFDEMVVEGKFATAKTDNTPHTFRFSDATVEIYFSPSDEVEAMLVDVISATQETMHFSMFFWTSDRLGDLAVTKAVTDGVTIAGVWDALGARNSSSEDEKLCGAGIPVKIELAGGKAHNKLAVLDWNGVTPVVVTGSYNWTASGTESNDENIVIVSGNTAIAQRYYEEVMYVYNALPNETICGNISAESGIAACSNGRDDDFDFQIDEADSNCAESTVATCTDRIDNDGDEDIDSADLDCWLYNNTPTSITLVEQKSVITQIGSLLNWAFLSLLGITLFVVGQYRVMRRFKSETKTQ